MEQITIVYPATVDWNLLYQRPQQMLTHMAKLKGVRCIFVNSEAYRPMKNPITPISENMFVVSPRVDYSSLLIGKKVLWYSYPPQHMVHKLDKFDFVVFDAIDNPTDEFAGWKAHLDTAVAKSNMVVATADIMYNYHKERTNKPVVMIPNGADYDHFKVAKDKSFYRPNDLPKMEDGQKLIGFYGALASWVDHQLVLTIAERHPVAMIGKNPYYFNGFMHPNIHYIDHKDYKELPMYLTHFDVAMVPFKLTEMIKGCDPIKFYEYLSAGKPVIATEMDELKKFSDVTYFVNRKNVHEVIEKALVENSPEKVEQRMKVAQDNSWDARARLAVDMIRTHLKK